MQSAIADLDARITMVDGASSVRLTGTAVDERLRAVTRPVPAAAPDDPGLIGLFFSLIAQVLSFVRRGVLSSIDPYVVVILVAGVFTA